MPWLLSADFLPVWCSLEAIPCLDCSRLARGHNSDHRFLRKVCHMAMAECSAISSQAEQSGVDSRLSSLGRMCSIVDWRAPV